MNNLIRTALFLFIPLLFKAQTYHFSNFSVKDGLAQSNVSGIVQDSAGFYWIATAGGISRFDGSNFINYSTENGLADNNISAIFVDRNHKIWMGHENGTLTRFDGTKFTEIKSRLLPRDKKIYGFFQDKNGSLWVCTETAGAVKIVDPTGEKAGHQTITYSGKEGLSQYVLSANEDADGNMWFLTDIGIKIYNKASRSFDFFKSENYPLGPVTVLVKDREHNFVMGTINGSIARYNPATKEFTTVVSAEQMTGLTGNVGPNIIYTMLEDREGNLWASILNHGVLRWQKKTAKLTLFNSTNGLSVNKVKSITEDREGNILLGTAGEGLEVFSSERFVSYTKNNGLIDNQVWAICKDKKGCMWFGTNEGITVYDPKETGKKAYRNYTTANGLPSNNVRAIVEDGYNNLWIATWGGRVVKYDVDAGKFVSLASLNDIVNTFAGSLLIDRRNNLWIGTNEGIVRYDITSQVIKTMRTIDGLSDNDISCLFEDSKGQIWIGTKQKGVTVFDGKSYKKYNRENGLNYNSISSISEDSKKRIWIGTEGGGAVVFDGTNFESYKVKNGLTSDFITLIAPDKQKNMWMGSNKGLTKYSPGRNEFSTYTQHKGFTGLETKPRSVYCDEEGNMWFGTVNGAYKYSPSLDAPVKEKPIVKLLQFRVNLNDFPLSGETELAYNENNLNFDFIGISLSNPAGVEYKIKLEGYDDYYKTLVGSNSVDYSNLNPGRYKFILVACNSSGVCADPLERTITITPPYWKTWWFYLIVFTVVVSGLFTYIKIRERALRHEKKILEEKVNERTAEVVQKNKELDEINKDITASIRYAKRIQDAILPPDDYVKKHLPNTFVLFKPKDIVSGDFYWMEDRDNHIIFAAVDCTGHGVPGAFMSIVGHNLLDRVISEHKISEPARILDELNKGISDTLRQSQLEDNTVRDGMDIALCSFNKKTGELQFAGAFNPLWLIRGKELVEIKANKFPIGNSRMGENNKFTNHSIPLQKGDTLYIFSDGYCDQFGGPSGKKFKASALRQLLLANQHLTMDQQKELLDNTIESWRGQHEQVDDILVIGTRYV